MSSFNFFENQRRQIVKLRERQIQAWKWKIFLINEMGKGILEMRKNKM